MREFYISSIHSIYEDDFEYGEGEHVNTFELNAHIKADTALKAVVIYLNTVAGFTVPDDAKIETHDEISNIALWGATVDNDNREAQPYQIEKWKEGKFTLYSDHTEITVKELIPVMIY